jgi:hypothetical protein
VDYPRALFLHGGIDDEEHRLGFAILREARRNPGGISEEEFELSIENWYDPVAIWFSVSRTNFNPDLVDLTGSCGFDDLALGVWTDKSFYLPLSWRTKSAPIAEILGAGVTVHLRLRVPGYSLSISPVSVKRLHEIAVYPGFCLEASIGGDHSWRHHWGS